jgi:hypothetical protein
MKAEIFYDHEDEIISGDIYDNFLATLDISGIFKSLNCIGNVILRDLRTPEEVILKF